MTYFLYSHKKVGMEVLPIPGSRRGGANQFFNLLIFRDAAFIHIKNITKENSEESTAVVASKTEPEFRLHNN